MKLVSVVGARPQFVKLAPIAQAAAVRDVEHVIVHTGQHYDAAMSDAFFDELRIPQPDVNLAIGSGLHGAQTGAMLSALEPVLAQHSPDWVLVYGDTNSTLAAAICAVKLHLPLAHLEAGLRSYNRRMPEEHNRVLADHAADLCLAPTQNAVTTLASEGLAERTTYVGDVMVDVLLRVLHGAALRPARDAIHSGDHPPSREHGRRGSPPRGRRRTSCAPPRGPPSNTPPARRAMSGVRDRSRARIYSPDRAARLFGPGPNPQRVLSGDHRLRRSTERGIRYRGPHFHAADRDRVGGDAQWQLERAGAGSRTAR